MAMPQQLVICALIKVLIVLLTIAVLILLDPVYVTAYINLNYEIVMIYIFSALTLLYCVVSVILYVLMTRGQIAEDVRLTNVGMAEFICGTAGLIGWILVIGIGGNISQRTIIETGERFGWIGAIAGIITACFLGIMAIFLLNIVNEKILQPRQAKYRRPNEY
ncbi:unnamed protein product, partial [Mesorhabditis belari]|uniref:MARVEL domain-containing protein n=1 Tax=Mesorhabditis belari TaxID=2138241 RepID=A0AAF3E8X5_9BILA